MSIPAIATPWVAVCAVAELEPFWGEAALIDDVQVAVVLLPGGVVHAVSNEDPVTGAFVMSRGIVGSRGERTTIASPLNKQVYDLATGECLTADGPGLRVFPVRVSDGSVEIGMGGLDATPAPALVAASHGTSDPAGRRAVAQLCAEVAAALPAVDVHPCFVDVQQPDVPETLNGLDPTATAVLVPLLLSAGYHVRTDLARDARDAGGAVTVANALGPDARLARVLARRLEEAGLRPDDTIVLAAAGSSDSRAVDDCEVVGAQLAAELGRPVTVGYLSAAVPRLPDAVADARAKGHRVVAASYLLAPGYFAGLVHQAGADLVSSPLLVDGEPVPGELVDVVVDRYLAACNADVSAALQAVPAGVTT